jgi:hypothetical protein
MLKQQRPGFTRSGRFGDHRISFASRPNLDAANRRSGIGEPPFRMHSRVGMAVKKLPAARSMPIRAGSAEVAPAAVHTKPFTVDTAVADVLAAVAAPVGVTESTAAAAAEVASAPPLAAVRPAEVMPRLRAAAPQTHPRRQAWSQIHTRTRHLVRTWLPPAASQLQRRSRSAVARVLPRLRPVVARFHLRLRP